ncbi:UPF0489 protein C5orf22 homolog [Ostrea edulis]|uniref:UPF0489 protein C5orf22 homolog n=1 Tax=Ostrea edulis TaxID=37623 RepID=UPI0024AE95DF|nr:UPF0489 protein C5orf22 homolog [Ostrea edulis]
MDTSKKLKNYKRLPLYIVEDHNEVLPYVHRAIGSHHLPFSNLLFVHFDSHPDMLIPKDMPADEVFNKEALYEGISIENWIMPLVYAGHVSVILWVKPPWCTQIADKNIQFYVGKCATTGTIRCSCKESYFVSETLYRPESELTNKKLVQLIVFTLKPSGWKEMSDSCKSAEQKQKGKDGSEVIEIEGKNRNICQNNKTSTDSSSCVLGPHSCSAVHENLNRDCEQQNENLRGTNDGEFHCGSLVQAEIEKTCCDGGNSDKLSVSGSTVTNAEHRITNEGRHTSEAEHRITNEGRHTSETQRDYGDSAGTSKSLSSCGSGTSTSSNSAGDKFRDSLTNISELLQEFSDKTVILDIDLDFYSTKNPFLEVYTPSQYQILQELYCFQAPSSNSDEDVEECVLKREEELNRLKEELLKFTQCSEPKLNHSKSNQIKALVEDLKSSRTNDDPVNFDLLHEAGCTCDDTELPHHVSSQEEITLLVDATQDFLCHLKRPTIITMARSSEDDYCPPDQVDHIMFSVLEILQDLYLEVEVSTDYE